MSSHFKQRSSPSMCLLRSLWLKWTGECCFCHLIIFRKHQVQCRMSICFGGHSIEKKVYSGFFSSENRHLEFFSEKNIYRFSISSIVCEKQSWKEFMILNEKNKTFSGTFFLRVEDKSRKVESLMTSSSVIRDKKVPSFNANLTKIQQKKRWIIMSVPCVCESVCVCECACKCLVPRKLPDQSSWLVTK